jgi:hypothetical protein
VSAAINIKVRIVFTGSSSFINILQRLFFEAPSMLRSVTNEAGFLQQNRQFFPNSGVFLCVFGAVFPVRALSAGFRLS